MMKRFVTVLAAALLLACNNSKKDKPAPENVVQPENRKESSGDPLPANTDSYNNTVVIAEGKEVNLSGSILVDKDKKNLQAGAPYRGMITTGSGPDNEGFILRFVFDTKPGIYPLTGQSFNRGKDATAEQYGGLLGGEEKIYEGKVNITECKDLGDNNAGGHRWSIGGTVENLTIPAMGLMLMDKESKHPKEIKIDKISFSNLTFDDNAEEMLKKAMEMLKDRKKNE